jgi:hypothetical protein
MVNKFVKLTTGPLLIDFMFPSLASMSNKIVFFLLLVYVSSQYEIHSNALDYVISLWGQFIF